MAGLAGLIGCAIALRVPDWDIGISILMGVLTYVSAPWAVRTVLEALRNRRDRWLLRILAATIVAVAVVDGSYLLYSALNEHPTFRRENFVISLSLYVTAGTIWMQDMPLREAVARFGDWLRYKGRQDK